MRKWWAPSWYSFSPRAEGFINTPATRDRTSGEDQSRKSEMEEVKKMKTKRAAAAAAATATASSFEGKNEELEKALVAIGTLLLVAGLKHVFASLLEKWRNLAFFLLNLLLLSIFFMSLRSDDSSNLHKDTHGIQTSSEKKIQRRKRVDVEELYHCSSCIGSSNTSVRDAATIGYVEEVDDCDGDGDAGADLSKEELNAKVEAFISNFRHQLALDAKGRTSRRHYASPPQGVKSYSHSISN